jgi:hypothetical protein
MKRTLLAVVVLNLAVNPAFAETKARIKSNPQASTATKSAKRLEEPRPVAEKHETLQPFSLEILDSGKIDPNFKGVPVATMVESLEALTKIKKGEFESTADFEARKNGALSKKLVDNVGINDLLPFVAGVKKLSAYSSGLAYSYDADATEASLYVLPAQSDFNGIGGPDYKVGSYNRSKFDTLELGRAFDKGRTYEASNAYGATVQVEESRSTLYSFATERIPYVTVKRERYYASAAPAIRLKMDAGIAAKELPALKALLVVQLRSPYLLYDFFHAAPTRDNPRELTMQQKSVFGEAVKVIFYSGITGQILAQFPETVPSSVTSTSSL